MRMLMLTALAGGLVVAPTALGATPLERRTQWYETRSGNQEARIAAATEAGRIGEREAQFLSRQQAGIDAAYARRIEDGRLGVRDLRALDRRLDRGSAAIRAARLRGPRG
jgi:hypothetical protein